MNNFFKSAYYLLPLLFCAVLFVQCSDEKTDTAGTEDAYPADMVKEETNMASGNDMPMEIGEVTSAIEKQQLLALLMRQKTNVHYRIGELKNMPGDASNNTIVRGDIDKLRMYMDKLDQEIVDVRKAQAGTMKEVTESALGAIKGAGALMQSSIIRIDQGF